MGGLESSVERSARDAIATEDTSAHFAKCAGGLPSRPTEEASSIILSVSGDEVALRGISEIRQASWKWPIVEVIA